MVEVNLNHMVSIAVLRFIFCLINMVSLSSGEALNTTQDTTRVRLTNRNAEVVAFLIPEQNVERSSEILNLRFRRQTGGGKYSEASKMPQMKLLQLFLQMFSNMWSRSYVGGAHPLHHEVPKPVVKLYKEKIMAFFFPDIEAEKGQQPS